MRKYRYFYNHTYSKASVFAPLRSPMHRHRQNMYSIKYRCESQWKYHKGACYQVSVKEEEIKAEVFALLRKHAEAILGRHIRIERMTPVKNAAADTELEEINGQLASSGHFLKSLYESMVAELITADEFTAMKTDYEGKIAALSKRADRLRTQRRERASEQESYRGFTDAVSDTLSSNELTADAINCLVEKIQVQRDKSFEILLRFKDEFQEVKRVG